MVVAIIAAASATFAEAPPLKALIVDGQNNHDWVQTSPVLRTLLEASGRFEVAVATSPPAGQPMDEFQPEFAAYDVIVLNYNGDDWPEPTREAFVEYVRSGGGVVVFHAADNPFPDWNEFNEIIGLGGWGGRNETAGPMVRYRDGKVVLDNSPGRGGSHPPKHDFQVIHRDTEHPITRGLPTTWMHYNDEIYGTMRGPAKNLTLLATAYSDPERRNGTGEHEPMLFTIDYGEGRVFHTTLGHAGEQMQSVGFIVTLQRGTEWAATGEVTLDGVPIDFPSAEVVSLRPMEKLAEAVPMRRDPAWEGVESLADALAALPSYDFDRERLPLAIIESEMRGAQPRQIRRIEGKLLTVLGMPEATFAAKQFVCGVLREIGSAQAVPALAALLTNEKLSHMARGALEAMNAPEAGAALRDALPETAGAIKIGLVTSLGERGDREATNALLGLLDSDEARLQEAAIVALGKIGGARPAAMLATLDVSEALQPLVDDAQLQCADALLADGNRGAALAVYRELLTPSHSTLTRIGGAHGLVRAEGEAAMSALIPLLGDEDARVRQAAGKFLAEMPGDGVTPVLVDLIPTVPLRAQVALINAVAARGGEGVVEAIAEAAGSEDAEVRAAALEALGIVGGAEHVALLVRASAAEDVAGPVARESLLQLSGDDVCAAVIATLDTEQPSAARVNAIEALGRIGGPEALAALRSELRSRDGDAMLAAIEALGNWRNTKPTSDLWDIARLTEDPAIRAAAFRGYLRLAMMAGGRDKGRKLRALQEALRVAPGTEEKGLVLDELAGIGSVGALEMVRPLLDDPELADRAKPAFRKIAKALGVSEPLGDEIVLHAKDATVHGQGAMYQDAANRDCIGNWKNVGAWVSWNVQLAKPGAFDVEISQSMRGHAGAEYTVEIGEQRLAGVVIDTGDWARFESQPLGRVTVEAPGVYAVAFKPVSKTKGYVINLRSVTLRRVATEQE